MKKINRVCVIDDDNVCLFLIRKALEKSDLIKNIDFYQNGSLAIEALKLMDAEKEMMPSAIFLDLNMPVMCGWDFLSEIQKLENLALLPVYILSSSNREEDIEKSKLYSNVKGYIVKPIKNESFDKILKYL